MAETFNFDLNFEDLVLATYIANPDKFLCRGDILKSAYFSSVVSSLLMECVVDYQIKYARVPSWEAIYQLTLDKCTAAGQDPKAAHEYFKKLRALEANDTDYVLDRVIAFCKHRALINAVKKVARQIREGEQVGDEIIPMFEEATQIGENLQDLGFLFHNAVDEVIDKVQSPDFGVRTGFPQLDSIWKTGWAPGWCIALLAPPKRYKCLGKDTPVLMHDGSVKMIQDVKVGDLLMGDDSKPRRVLTSGHGRGPLFEVWQKSGRRYVSKFVCNDAHILCVQYRDGKTTKEITAKEYYESDPVFKHYWRAYRSGVEFLQKNVPIEPYYFGLWLGDGSSYDHRLCIGDADHEIWDYVYQYAERLGMEVYESGGGEGCKGCTIRWDPKTHKHWPSKEWIPNTLGIGIKSLNVLKNKHVPQIYKINSRKNRLELLAGLIDSDGHRDGSRFIFTNTNEQLAKDVQWLARSLGFRSNIGKSKTGIKSIGFVGSCWRVTILGNIGEIPVKVARKKAGVESLKLGTRYPIKLVPIGDGDYYGITIDGNERFLLGDFTVTHNTTVALNIALNVVGPTVGEDVIYYACEISGEQAVLKGFYNITGQGEDIMFDTPEAFKTSVREAISQKVVGNLVIKHFPIGTATVGGTIRNHTRMLMKQLGIKPKLIVIDYADTVMAATKTADDKAYITQANVYKEAIAVGKEVGAAVLIPDRLTAEAAEQKVPVKRVFQGAFAKGGIVDGALVLCQTPTEYQKNIFRTFVFVNRHGPAFQYFQGSIDPALSKIDFGDPIPYNPEDEEKDDKPTKGKHRNGNTGVPDELIE